MAPSDDEEIPETGAIFTFGKTRFAENLTNKFWIRDDKVLQIACGDEHSAVVTSSGRLYTFGSNDWGQLGHGNTKPYNKPSIVKKLKGDRVKFVACGRSHSLVITESGVFSFGAGADSQLGHGDNQSYNMPTEIDALNDVVVTQVGCGAEHSAALTDNGELYMWGSGSEGQLGLGISECEVPTLLKFQSKVMFVSCGYYHTAVITENGEVHTFGDNEAGQLGLDDDQCENTDRPQHVKALNEPAIAVACGGSHTAVLMKSGRLFTFGSGMHGQLGHGTSLQDMARPKLVSALQGVVVSAVSCGESHTAVLTKNGEMYTFGDGRHGKLAMGDDSFSNLFKPAKVARLEIFHVELVSCGGCHMLAAAVRKHEDIQDNGRSEEDKSDDVPRLSQTIPTLGISARDKRRQKDIEGVALSSSLPLLNRSLPPLNSLGLHSNPKKEETTSDSSNRLNPLNRSALPIISIKSPSADEDAGVDKVNLRQLPPRPKRRQKQFWVLDSEEENDRRQKGTTRPTPPPRKSRTAKENLQNNEDKIEPSGEKQIGSEASGEESDDYDKHSPSVSHHIDEAKERREPIDEEMSGEDESEEDGGKTERRKKEKSRTMTEAKGNNQEETEEDDSEEEDEDKGQRDGEKKGESRTIKGKDNGQKDEIESDKYEDVRKKDRIQKDRKQKDVKERTAKETRQKEEGESEKDKGKDDGNSAKMNESEQSEEDEGEEDESDEGDRQKDGKWEDKEKEDMKCRKLKEMEHNCEEDETEKEREDDEDSEETGRKEKEKVEDKEENLALKKDTKNKKKGKTKVDKENEEDGKKKHKREQVENEGAEDEKEENGREVIGTKTKRSGICSIL